MTATDDIEGVGPAYAEELAENGYESAEDVAEANPDDIDDVLASADGAEVVAAATELVEDDADVESEEKEAEEIDDDRIVFSPNFSDDQRNHLIRALVDREITARRTNQPDKVELIKDAIDNLIEGEPYQLTLEQIAEAYTGINQHEDLLRSDRGIAGFVAYIREIQDVLQTVRSENWPE